MRNIIDFHTHTFPDKIAGKVKGKLQAMSGTPAYTDMTESALAASMKEADIRFSVTLPVMTSPEQVVKLNSLAIEGMKHYEETGLITFGGMHPDFADYKAELKRLSENGVKGIKIHPAYQGVDLDDIRFMNMIDAASEEGLIVLTHGGPDIGYPGHDYASVEMSLKVIDTVHPEKFVLAHMGSWKEWDSVKKYLAGAKVYLDTAFTLDRYEILEGAKWTDEDAKMLTDEDFISLVRAHGTDQILFATDSPWSDQKTYVSIIDRMDLSVKEKEDIFYHNAKKLLNI